uniref:Gustatory receptor n=1 Tax=Epiphyas postvittana TaxID=65032 RepID=A0A0K8TVN5_EPIPO
MCTVLRKYFSPLLHRNEDLRLLEVFKPLYYILSIFGLFPYSIDFLYGKKYLNVAFKSASFTLACNFVVPTVICVFFALHMLELDVASRDNAFTEDEMTKTNFIIEMVCQFLVCMTAYICAFKNRSLYINVLNEMSGCWTNLPKNVGSKILGQLQIKAHCVLFGSILLVPLLESPMTYLSSATAWKKILVLVTFVLPELIQFVLIAFYFVLIMMVVALLENIEEHVKILYHSKSCWTSSNIVEDAKPLPASLRQLRDMYARALAVKRQVNAAFQAPLMLLLAQSFHTLISEAHFLFHGLTFQNDFNVLGVFDCCVWIVLQIIKIYILGHSGAILNQQATEIGRTLHNIPADIDEDISLYLEIQHFTTLMKFQAANITVFGYFSLESSLIFNVTASATMYLVILVQFDKST